MGENFKMQIHVRYYQIKTVEMRWSNTMANVLSFFFKTNDANKHKDS